jgi:glycosyltransferase involved in cell wall biosynthesis
MQQRRREERRPLRVLHVIQALTGGGAENVLCALVTRFDERVVQPALMSVYPTATPEELSSLPILKIERQGRYDPWFFARMVRAMRELQPDVVHAHLHNGKCWGRLAAIVARVPIVLFTEHSPRGDRRVPGERLLDAAVDRITDGTITFTEHQRNLLIRFEHVPAAKVTVIQNGIVLPQLPSPQLRVDARRRLGADDNEFALLVVGRLVPIKNKRLAVEAMKHVSPNVRDRLRMYVVGSGEEEEFLRALARSEGVGDRVCFMGHRDDAVDLLYGGDALYMPSHIEGMPLAVLEAMSVGLPVISTPWPGVSDLLQEGELGMIVSDWEPQTSAAAFEAAVASRGILTGIAERAQEFARAHYAIDCVARLHEALYVQLASRKGLFALQPSREPVPVR